MRDRTYFDRILASFIRAKPRDHAPRFHIQREQNNWRVFDGPRAIALFMPLALDIWSFSPFEADQMANTEPPGKLLDLHTVHNTLINLGVQGWPRHWRAHGDMETRVKWMWRKKNGPELLAQITVAFP